MDEMKGGKEKKKDHCRTISKFKLQNHRKRHNRQSITHKHMDAHLSEFDTNRVVELEYGHRDVGVISNKKHMLSIRDTSQKLLVLSIIAFH